MGCRGDSSKAEEKQKNTLECVIPFPGQADSREKADQKRRYNILTATDESVITSSTYSKGCYFTRNRYMVDKADVVVCAFNGQRGGTAYTVNYALKQNKIVLFLLYRVILLLYSHCGFMVNPSIDHQMGIVILWLCGALKNPSAQTEANCFRRFCDTASLS